MRKKLQVTLTFGNSDEGGDKYKKLNMEKRITSFNKTKKKAKKKKLILCRPCLTL